MADERRSLALAAGLAVAGAVLHAALIPDSLRERSDLPHYLESAARWAIDGAAPYREIPFEYPPAALLLLRAPVALVAWGVCHFETALAFFLAGFDALALFAAFLLAREGGASFRRGLSALAFAWAGLLLCGSLLFTRFDLAPAALLALGVALSSRSPAGAGVAMGAATALKLYPFWSAPVLAVRLWQEKKVGIAIISGLAAALFLSLPAMLPAGSDALSFLGYHGARGVQFQSLWGSLWMVLGQRGFVRVELAHAFGAEEVASAPRWLSWLATALPILWMLACAAITRRQAGRARVRTAALAALCGFVALGKIGSPQFSIALAPLAAGCLFDAPLAALALLVSFALSAWQFPFHHADLMANQGPWAALGLVRMLLVLGAGIWLLYKRTAPASTRLDGEREAAAAAETV